VCGLLTNDFRQEDGEVEMVGWERRARDDGSVVVEPAHLMSEQCWCSLLSPAPFTFFVCRCG